jgi:hypothetical protein
MPPAATTGVGGDRVHDPWHQRHGRDFSGHVASRLDALGDNHIHASPGGLVGGGGRPYLMAHLPAYSVHTGDVGGRVAPEERHHRHSLFDTDGHCLFAREMEEEVYPKRLVGQLPHTADCLAQQQRWMELSLHDLRSARRITQD